MPISFNCPVCGHHYGIGEEHAGKRTRCIYCAARITVPEQSEEPRAQAPVSDTEPSTPSLNPYGGIAPQRDIPMKRRLNYVLLGAAGLLLLGMFLPWNNWPDPPPEGLEEFGGYISGIELPFRLNYEFSKNVTESTAEARRRGVSQTEIDRWKQSIQPISNALRSVFALLLIPIMALIALGDEQTSAGKGLNRWWVRLVLTLSPWIAFLVIYVSFSTLDPLLPELPEPKSTQDEFDGMGIGFWVVCLGSLVSLVSIFVSPRARPAEND